MDFRYLIFMSSRVVLSGILSVSETLDEQENNGYSRGKSERFLSLA